MWRLIWAVVTAVTMLVYSGCAERKGADITSWQALIDPAFDQAAVVAEFRQEVARYAEGSPEEKAVYARMQHALEHAGNNPAADGKSAYLEGYLVPLDTQGDRIVRFLFFPTQAACIHVPASPANQTILVETKPGEGVTLEDAYDRFGVYGVLRLERHEEGGGTASFVIRNAETERIAGG